MKIFLGSFLLLFNFFIVSEKSKVEYIQHYDSETKKFTITIRNNTDSLVTILLSRDYGDFGNRSSLAVNYLDEQSNTVSHMGVLNIVDPRENGRLYFLEPNKESVLVYELIPNKDVSHVVKIRTIAYFIYCISKGDDIKCIYKNFVHEYDY